MIDSQHKVEWLDKPVRGPGGHWYKYKASNVPDDGTYGYGDTERQAVLELKSQSNETP